LATEVVRVFCLDVGQGDATVVVGPKAGSAIIVDAVRPRPVLEVLRTQRISHIPIALLTHDDEDHIAGFANVLTEFIQRMGGRIDIVAYDQVRFQASHVFVRHVARITDLCLPQGPTGPRVFQLASPTTNDSLLEGALRGTRRAMLLYPSKTDVESLARRVSRNRARWSHLRPRSRPNEASAILVLEWAGQRMLLGADLGTLGWTVLSQNKNMSADLRADVFRFPHHGGRFGQTGLDGYTISQAELLRLVNPSAVIISVGTSNRHSHPDPETVRAICSRKATRLLCTQATTLCVGDQCGPSAHNPEPIECAGTVVVTLGGGIRPTITPSRSAHARVIDTFATPACRAHP